MPNTDSSAPAATTDTSALDLSTFIPDAEQPQAPVDLQGFIPDPPQAAPAPGLEGFIADDPADQHLNESTRNQLVQRAAQDYVAGKTTDADLAKYKIAYGKRWATGDLLDADNRPDHVKAAEQVPIEKFNTGNKTVDAVGDTLGELAPAATRMGQSLFESIFTQLNEAGRAVQAYDLMTAQSVTLADAATSGENVIAGVKLSAIRSANILRTLANRVVDKVLVRAAEADTKHGILNDADRSQLADTRFDHDLAVSLAEIGVKEGAIISGPARKTDPETVELVSNSPLSDPTMMIPGAQGLAMGRGGKIAARVLESAAPKGAAATVAEFAGKQAAKPFEFAARSVAKTGEVFDNSPLLRGVVAAGVVDALGGSSEASVLAVIVGAGKKPGTLKSIAGGLQRTGDRIAGRLPAGPIGRFTKSVFDATAPELKGVVAGQLSNMPFLLGAGDEDAATGMVMAGVMIHGATRAVGATLNGLNTTENLWRSKPTMPESRMVVKHTGDVELDSAHQKLVDTLDNGDHNFVESVRAGLKKLKGGDVFTLGEVDFGTQIDRLAREGWGVSRGVGEAPAPLTPELASLTKKQAGVTLERVNPQTGEKQAMALTQVRAGLPGISVGHEATHLLELALSPAERRYIQAETLRYYGQEDAHAYHIRYLDQVESGRDRSRDPKNWFEMTDAAKDGALSEIFAEHGNAVLNAIPIAHFGKDGPVANDYSRMVYNFIDRAMEAVGAKQPKLVDGTGSVRTGTGIEPSARLGKVFENILQAKMLDNAKLPGLAPVDPRVNQVTLPAQAPRAQGENGPLQNVREIPKPAQPPVKKGDPVGDIHNAQGVLVAEAAIVTKVNTDGTVEVSFVHPDAQDGAPRLLATLPVADLPVSPVRPATTTITPGPAHPVGGAGTVLGSVPQPGERVQTPAQIVAPKQAENTTRPQGETRNVRTTPAEQNKFAAPADDATHRANRATLATILTGDRSKIPVVETDYYSAKSSVTSPDAVVREAQRKAADAAEKLGPNPLRAIYQKVFVPYRWTPWKLSQEDSTRLHGAGERQPGGVFGMSLDKVIQNLDMLRGSVASDQAVAATLGRYGIEASYLGSDKIRSDIQTYLENQSHGYGGDGTKLVRPADTKPGSVTPEDTAFSPRRLPPASMQVINLLMGIEQQASRSVGMEFNARFAEANGVTPSQVGFDEKLRPLVDTNALRADLRTAGFDPRILNSAVENLPTKNFTTPLKVRTDLNFPAGDTGIMAAGFMPEVVSHRRARGNEETRGIAGSYIRDNGIQDTPHEKYATINEGMLRKIADHYDQAKHEPANPEVQKAYQALADETVAQYRAMEQAGIRIEPFTGKGEPYRNSADMMKDVRENKHLFFLKTEGAFGEGADASGNPLLAPSDVVAGGYRLPINDVFRAVHDFFGHTAEGYEFGPRGELNAYLAHSRMFTDAAKPALAAETLAQNAWVNFGPHLRRTDGTLPVVGDADFKAIKDRRFADQKTTVVPLEMLGEADAHGRAARYMPEAKQINSPEFKKWFGDWTDPKAFTSRAKGPVSMVVKDGKPLKVFHATTKSFDAFESGRPTFDDMGLFGNVETNRHAIFFSDSPEQAASYVTDPKGRAEQGARTIPAYLDMKSPMHFDANTNFETLAEETGINYRWLRSHQNTWEMFDGPSGKEFVDGLKKAGYDGAIFEEDAIRPGVKTGKTYAAFEPTQIKSATGNSGAFDGANTDIRFMPDVAEKVIRGLSKEEKQQVVEAARHGIFLETGQYDSPEARKLKTPADVLRLRGEEGLKKAMNTAGVIRDLTVDPDAAPAQTLTDAPRNGRKLVRGNGDQADATRAGNARLEGEKLPGSVPEENLQLVHYSGLLGTEKIVDPSFLGRGAATGNDTKGLPGSFWFVDGSPLKSDYERVAQGRDKYTAEVSGNRIYNSNAGHDSLNFWGPVNRAKADQMLIDQGYAGWTVVTPDGREVVKTFEPVPVTPHGKHTDKKNARFMPEAATAPRQTDTPEFKKWFGESKVTDTEGEPRVVYHGTSANFNSFNPKKATQGIFWFTSDRGAIDAGEVGAQGKGRVMDLFAQLKNPAGWDEYGKKSLGELRRDGYDGAILPESDGTITGFVFEPEQLKSASKNRGTFDGANKDVRFMPEAPRQTDTPEFKKWFGESVVADKDGPKVVWHGSDAVFNAFDMSKAVDGAHFFSDDSSHAAHFGGARDFFVRIENPLTISQDHLEKRWDERVNDGGESGVLPRDMVKSFVDDAKRSGKDGLIIRGMADVDLQADVYLPFSPRQIKSASENVGSFDGANKDVRFMPDFAGEPAVRADFEKEFERVRTTQGTGNTFDAAGKTADTSQLPIIVTLGALTQSADVASAKKAQNFFNRHTEFLMTPNARPGLFNFDNKVSADLNVALPLTSLELAKQFARDNNQDSIYNAAAGDVVKTGGSGEPRLSSPTEYAVAAKQLADGSYKSIAEVKEIARGLAGTEVTTIPSIDVKAETRDALAAATAEAEKPLSKIRINRITAEVAADAAAHLMDLPVIRLDPVGERIGLNPPTPEKWDQVNQKVRDALRVTALDPELGLGEFGYRRAFAETGLRTVVPPPPEQWAAYVKDPAKLAKMLTDAQEKHPDLVASAVSGLEHVAKMHAMAKDGKLTPDIVAYHMMWGIASRMLAPFDQEGGWIRLARSPEVLGHIADSVNGQFSLPKDDWKAVVQKAMKDSNLFTDDVAASKIGKNATANLNAFHLMLTKWNGRWDQLTGIFNNPELSGPQMRDEFFKQGFGGAGIKHKVVSFAILTLARDDVFIGDRWQVVHGNLPLLERIAKEQGHASPFNYDKNGVPEDRVGVYKAYGPLIDSPSVGSVYYALVERALAHVGKSKEVTAVFGKPLSASAVHWLTWNIIKNEPVGHSSLELTHDLLAENKTLGTIGRAALAKELATRPIKTQRYNADKKGFDEFTVENGKANLRRAQ